MFSARQNEIIIGSLLGDGCIWTNFVDPLMKFTVGQSKLDHKGIDKKSYIGWLAGEFIDFGCSVRTRKVKASGLVILSSKRKFFDNYIFTTKCNQRWNDLEKKWYVPRTDHHWFKRRKIVPNDVRITPLTLFVWYVDDGSNHAKNANITLDTQGFTEEEVVFLIERLKTDLDIVGTIKWSHNKKWGSKPRIYIGRKSYFDFIDIVKPYHHWDCFQYKFDTSAYNKKPHRGETHSMAKLTEEKVRTIIAMANEGIAQKDIANKFNVTKASVSMIVSGREWGHIVIKRPEIKKKPRITKEQKTRILSMTGTKQGKIAEELGIDPSTVSRILSKSDK